MSARCAAGREPPLPGPLLAVPLVPLSALGYSNENSRPFVWTATADSIIAKVTRGKSKLETLH